jgi:hypothetical protein
MTDMAELPEQTKDAGPEVPPSARLLLRVVYIMGIALVLLFLVLVGAIIWKATHKPAAEPQRPPPVVDLGVPAGTTVHSVTLDGDRLAVNTGTEVIVVDIRKNSIIARVAIRPQ